MKRNNKKGFTIVELVIVIAVIGILAGVLIPTFSGIITQANESKAMQEARNQYTAYLLKHPEAGIDYVKSGSTYYDVDNGFNVVDEDDLDDDAVTLDVADWYIADVCADGNDTDSLCDKCGATVE